MDFISVISEGADGPGFNGEAVSVIEAYLSACVERTIKYRARDSAFARNTTFMVANRAVSGAQEHKIANWKKRQAVVQKISTEAAELVQEHSPAPGALSEEANAGLIRADTSSSRTLSPTFVVEDAFVHCWVDRREAKKVHHALRHLAQSMYDADAMWPLVTPCWVMVSHFGRLFSVMWMCPVASKDSVAFTALGHAQGVVEGLRTFTLLPLHAAPLRAFQGADGLWYIVDAHVVHGVPLHDNYDRPGTHRLELLQHLSRETIVNHRGGLNLSSIIDDAADEIAREYEPLAGAHMVEILQMGFIPGILHAHGLRLSTSLWAVRVAVETFPRGPEIMKLIDHELVYRAIRYIISEAMLNCAVPDYAPPDVREMEVFEAAETAWHQIRKGGEAFFNVNIMSTIRAKFDLP
jgi:hypothetical protein